MNSTDIFGLNGESFVQYVADNADHNTCTIDGNNTFHGMGIIATITPGVTNQKRPIPWNTVSAEDIRQASQITIIPFSSNENVLNKIIYQELSFINHEDSFSCLDLLWLSSWFFKQPRPGWNATMETAVKGNHSGKASVIFLPFIDLPSSSQ